MIEKVIHDPVLRESLKKIVDHEEKMIKYYKEEPIFQGLEPTIAWKMLEIPLEWKVLRRLLYADIVEKFGKKYYRLKDRGTVKTLLQEYQEHLKAQEEKITKTLEQGLPDDLFDVVEGYDDLKTFFKLSLQADDSVHVLLVGTPGTAKSLFLMEIERLGARFITGGTSTKVGIRDIIFDELPKILIIDEIDKISDSKDLSSILTWMESGRVIITKHGLKDERKGKGWVFAACNRTDRLPPELLDRFQVFHIKPYSKEQFIRVVTGYLTKRKGVEPDLAQYIAEKVQEYSTSVREAVRLALLAKTKGEVDKIIEIVKKYRE